MTVILRFLGAVLSVYMLLLFVRILLSWFSGPAREGSAVQMLYRITDPYLNWFRRFPFLRTGRIDFSPIAGIITIVIVLNIINTLAIYGRITVGIILGLIAGAVGSAAFFILGFMLILVVVRTVSMFVGASYSHPIWQTIDGMVQPIIEFIHKTLFRSREMTYRTTLITGTAVLAVVFFLGRYLWNRLVVMLMNLPF